MRRALIVIDAQNEYVTGAVPVEYPSLEVSLPNIGAAMDAAAEQELPIVVVQHVFPAGSPAFADGSEGMGNHEVVERRAEHVTEWVRKSMASAFAETELESWLRAREIDTITIAGYLTHNCVQSTAVVASQLGFDVEVLADASGAIPLANESGGRSARALHETYCVVLQSNFAAVLDTADWVKLLPGAEPVRSNLFASYAPGRLAD